jgi:ankyrin repeat protein
MDSLANKPTRRTLENALKTLPKELDLTYDEAMKRIEDQNEDDKELAWKILSWIVLTSRPLRKAELQHALAVEVGDSIFDNLNIPDDELLTAVCAGLVAIDVLDGTVRPIHYTTQEYFERVLRARFSGLQSQITGTCLTYLSFEPFAHRDQTFVAEVKKEYPFYLYAAENWYYDLKRSEKVRTECIDELKVFLRSPACLLLVIEYLRWDRFSRSHNTDFVNGWTRLHVAASLGIDDMVQESIQQSSSIIDEVDTNGRTGLHIAISYNRPSAAVILLGSGAGINAQSYQGRTPLHDALHTGNLDLSKLLIDRGAQVEIKDSNGATALHFAAWGGDVDAIRLILAKIPDANATTHENHTPLWYAVLGCHGAAVELLLSCGADMNIAERDDRLCPSSARAGRTPLHKSAQLGNMAVVNTFLARQPDLHPKDGDGYTPLDYAVLEEHCLVAEVLIKHGAVPTPEMLYKAVQAGSTEMARLISGCLNRTRYLGQNPLIPAIKRTDEELLNIILAMDTAAEHVNRGDSYGKTPLHWAAGRGFVVGVKQLLAAGADPSQQDNYLQTPLHMATEWNHVESAEILLRAGADANTPDLGGDTPLYRAVAMNSASVLRLLLSDTDTRISRSHLRPDEGGTLLHIAACECAADSLEVLLTDEQFLEIIDECNGQSETALLCAAERGHVDAVSLLVAHGADTNIKNADGHAALHIAAFQGHAAMIAALLDGSSTDIDVRDDEDRSALMLAVTSGHTAVTELLLQRGADANNQQLLHFAANGLSDVHP